MPHGNRSSGGDWGRQSLAELQPRAVDAGADRVWRQTAGPSDFVIAKAHDFAHQKDVAIEIGQRGQRFVDGKVDILGREPRSFFRQRRWLGAPQPCAVVIEREVPGDVKQPGPHLFFRARAGMVARLTRRKTSCVRSRAGLRSDCPAEILEQAMLVGAKRVAASTAISDWVQRTLRRAYPLGRCDHVTGRYRRAGWGRGKRWENDGLGDPTQRRVRWRYWNVPHAPWHV